MNIKIISNKALEISFSQLTPNDESKDNFKFGFSVVINDGGKEQSNQYSIIFETQLTHREGVLCKLKFESLFETDEIITSEFIETKFATINSPAIAYPFLRAYIANLMLSSGYSPIMIPTINFTKIEHNHKPE